jgi:hypothetical protein
MADKKNRTEYQKDYQKIYASEKKRINITVSHVEYKELTQLAKKEHTKVSALVKDMSLAYMQQKTFVPVDLYEELRTVSLLIRNIANNINQVAHHSNIVKGIVNENDLMKELQRLEQMVTDYTLKKLKENNDY